MVVPNEVALGAAIMVIFFHIWLVPTQVVCAPNIKDQQALLAAHQNRFRHLDMSSGTYAPPLVDFHPAVKPNGLTRVDVEDKQSSSLKVGLQLMFFLIIFDDVDWYI